MKVRAVSVRQARRRGVALLLVLFAVMLLSMLATALWDDIQFSRIDFDRDRSRFQAGQLAESGLALAQHPDVTAGDPVLRQDFGDGRSFVVNVGTEGGRILVNAIEDETLARTTRELFEIWGLDAVEAAVAVDSLADWIDDDEELRTNGAEKAFYSMQQYEQFPLNAALISYEQMLLVRGMDRVAQMQPRWRDYFTFYGDGSIDVNEASPELLEALFGTTREAAVNLVATRLGSDGVEGTEDDVVFEGLDEIQTLLGLSEEAYAEVEAWVTLQNPVQRIECVARVGTISLKRTLLIETGGDADPVPLARIEE